MVSFVGDIGMTHASFNAFRSSSAGVQSPASGSPLRGVVALRAASGRMIELMMTHPTIVGSVITNFAPSGLTIVALADKINPNAKSAASFKSQGQNQTV